MPNKYFQEIVQYHESLKDSIRKFEIIEGGSVLNLISLGMYHSHQITHIEDREELREILSFWWNYLGCRGHEYSSLIIDINIDAPERAPKETTSRRDELHFGLTNEEILNRVNACQASPVFNHKICPNDGVLLMFDDARNSGDPDYAPPRLVCIRCGYHQPIDPIMVRYSPRQLLEITSTVKGIVNSLNALDELETRLVEEVPEDWKKEDDV